MWKTTVYEVRRPPSISQITEAADVHKLGTIARFTELEDACKLATSKDSIIEVMYITFESYEEWLACAGKQHAYESILMHSD
jgi:hypothetical protein